MNACQVCYILYVYLSNIECNNIEITFEVYAASAVAAVVVVVDRCPRCGYFCYHWRRRRCREMLWDCMVGRRRLILAFHWPNHFHVIISTCKVAPLDMAPLVAIRYVYV